MNDMKHAAEQILRRGYATLPMPGTLRRLFEAIPRQLSHISPPLKDDFSFPERLDGFLPFGQEHAENNPDHPDLCERFCYFRKHRNDHEPFVLATTDFYRSIETYEREVASLSEAVLCEVFDHLGGQAPVSRGEDSYLQLCRYHAEFTDRGQDRTYLMDPHIDGQLLTFIAQTEQGLMAGDRTGMSQIDFSSSELFVMAGKLLELATDGEVKGLLHAVGRHASDNERISLMYFQNPDFSAPYQSLRAGNPIDFYAVANDIHQSYGNPSYNGVVTERSTV